MRFSGRIFACFALVLACAMGAAAGEWAEDLDQARQSLEQGEFEAAERMGRRLLAEAHIAQGPESHRVADALDVIVGSLLWQRWDFRVETRELAERAVRVRQKLAGGEASGQVESLVNLGTLLLRLGDYARGRELLDRAKGLAERSRGEQHPMFARVLDGLGIDARIRGDMNEAVRLHERALEIKRSALGPTHPQTLFTLTQLGRSVYQAGDAERALSLYEEAAVAASSVYPPQHPERARIDMGLGFALTMRGELDRARKRLERARRVTSETLGAEHAQMAEVVCRLGFLHIFSAEYEEAIAAGERALEIQSRLAGPDHFSLLPMLDAISWASYAWGDHEVGRDARVRALEITESYYGPHHARTVVGRGLVGMDLAAIGDYRRAETMLRQAVAGAEAIEPRHDRPLAIVRTNLAHVLDLGGQHEEAARLFEEAVPLVETVFGADSPWALKARFAQGMCLRHAGRYARAERAFREILEVRQERFGDRHSLVAEAHLQLGLCHLETGPLEDAIARFREALAIWDETAGQPYDLAAPARVGLSRALLLRGRSDEAVANALRAEDSAREGIRLVARALPERQALRYAETRAGGLDLALSALASGQVSESSRVSAAFDALIRSRALVLDEMARRQHALRRSGAPRVDRLMADLSAARERLANLVVRGPQGDPIERYTAMVEQANVKKEELEAELGTLSREGREESARRQIGLEPIARALSAGSALVAYVRFARHAVGEPTEAPPSASEPYVHPEPVPAYAAFVLGAGDSAPAFAPLGDAGDIDPLVEAWREQATHAPVRLTAASDRADQRYREAADRLRAAIWDPVIAMTGRADRLFVVPDGPLHLVSLSTLTDEDGRYLIEAGPSIHYLSAERELAARRSRDCGGRKLLAIGGPDFDAEGIEIGKALSRRGLRGPQAGIEAFPLGSASALAGATQEIRDIAELWAGQFEDTGAGVTCLSGAAASEQALKRLAAGHELLHVATHGYFLRDVGRSSDGALLRSGLLLAGANRRRDASGTEGDGILTAEEVASLDLSCARWAVLSGCESGLGTLRAGEGVLGLRRAFRVAGARTLIMSLWHVEDQATREWMCRLYQHRLEGADTCEAVRRTGLDVLAARREAGLSAHPFYWGAFVAEGDWR